MNKEEIIVSAEVKTFLCDLYSQIEYELQEQYKDEVQKLQAKVNQLETSIATKDSELLQLKEELRQLKTNRDEAIKYIKYHTSGVITDEDIVYVTPSRNIVEILERECSNE
jgi:predicted RNase H-like nuclease (RuvC/YqgF family)